MSSRTCSPRWAATDILHAVGCLKDSPPTLREAQPRGQLTPAELVDRHPITNRAVRDVLVHYIAERSREPSNTEWQDFRDHFSLRKVALGTCDRPYGTLCQHENACVRCPMLRLNLAQEPRLLEIETNTRQRLGEAHRMQWLGEVAGLQESLRHITDKKRQAERLRAQAGRGEDGVTALG